MKRYFIWKDANCNGINPEWKEITGTEYFALMKTEPHRRLMPFDKDGDYCADDFWFEVTNEVYMEWDKTRKQKDRDDEYLKKNVQFVSFDDLVTLDDEEGLTWAEVIPDTREDEALYDEETEKNKKIMKKMLPEAMNELPNNQRVVVDIILAWYEEEIERRNEEEKNTKEEWKRNVLNARPFVPPEDVLAKKIGIPKRTFNYRKIAAYKKMREFYEKNLPTKIISSNK